MLCCVGLCCAALCCAVLCCDALCVVLCAVLCHCFGRGEGGPSCNLPPRQGRGRPLSSTIHLLVFFCVLVRGSLRPGLHACSQAGAMGCCPADIPFGLGALLVVQGPGPGTHPPMGGKLPCHSSPYPPWCCGCSWGPGLGAPTSYWGGCCPAMLLQSLLATVSAARPGLYPASLPGGWMGFCGFCLGFRLGCRGGCGKVVVWHRGKIAGRVGLGCVLI